MEYLILLLLLVIMIYGQLPSTTKGKRQKPKVKMNPVRRQRSDISPYNDLIEFKLKKRSYMRGSSWDKKRREILYRDKYTCQSCGAKNTMLQVHHTKGYLDIPLEDKDCLITLCRPCHIKEHRLHGFPKTYQDYRDWDHPIIKRKNYKNKQHLLGQKPINRL